VIATVSVGTHPQAAAVDSKANKIYVANTHSNTVTVIDGANNSVAATLDAGHGPYAVAVNAAAEKVYVSNLGSKNVTAIDTKMLR
jgi:YVTN family beta-propeller protein